MGRWVRDQDYWWWATGSTRTTGAHISWSGGAKGQTVETVSTRNFLL